MSGFKQVTIKSCKQCGACWYTDAQSVTLTDQDRVELIMMKISYCKNCRGQWEKTSGGGIPPYDRAPINRRKR